MVLHTATVATGGCVFGRALEAGTHSSYRADLGDGHWPLLRVNNGVALVAKEGIGEWKRILGTNNSGQEGRRNGGRIGLTDRQALGPLGPLFVRHFQ